MTFTLAPCQHCGGYCGMRKTPRITVLQTQTRLGGIHMTFIGIAIFTVYTAQTVFIGGCAYRPPSAGSICADMYRSQLQETGHSEFRYAGEFPSIEACQKVVGAMKYVPEKGERVGEIIEVLCVPKSSASNPTGEPK